jgi:hypothetical protein
LACLDEMIAVGKTDIPLVAERVAIVAGTS